MCASTTSYVKFTPIAAWFLDNIPQLYNPLHSTFNSRTIHQDGGYSYETPVIYVAEDGYVRKVLATSEDRDAILSVLSAENGLNDELLASIDDLKEKESYLSFTKGMKIVRCAKYQLGTELKFTSSDYNAGDYILSGLSGNEDWGTWTNDTELSMRFRTDSICERIHGEITCHMFNGSQAVTVYANDVKVYENSTYTGGSIGFDFDNPAFGTPIRITVELPEATSPLAIGQSGDSRNLALGITGMVFTES